MEEPVNLQKENFRIFFRIVPALKMQWEYVKILSNMKTIFVRFMQDSSPTPSYWKYDTDGAFYNNTQYEIYKTIMPNVIDKAVSGCNVVIIAYGQTGSGKSLTTSALLNTFVDRGIAPRLISDLFAKKESVKQKLKVVFEISYIETNKEILTDLLNLNTALDSHSLKHVTKIKIADEYSALKLLFKAEGRRKFSKTVPQSHLSNGVLTIHVTTKPVNSTDPTITSSKIHIVDLAGVDSSGNPSSLHKNIGDLGNANLAKSQLEQFILILNQNNSKEIHVKKKLNILILYLADSLNSHSILRFIGHIRTDRENLVNTLSMLRFGQFVRCLKPQRLQENYIRFTEEPKDPILYQQLIDCYKERDLNMMLMNDGLSTNLTQDRIKHMQNVAQEYLENKTDEIVLINVTDADIALKVFRNLHENLQIEKDESIKAAYAQAYEDALNSLRRTSSKAESVKSTKSSRKGSKSDSKSNHESVAKSKLLKQSVKDKPRTSKSSDHGAQIRRSKGSSIIMKKSPSRRRSNASTTRSPVHDIILEESLLPDFMPSQEEAWEMFTNDENSRYNELKELLDTSEDNARLMKESYVTEVNVLQKLVEVLENRQIDYQKAQMQRLFQKQELDNDCNVVQTDLENLCLKNLKTSQTDVVLQQEKLLNVQTEFNVALECFKNCKEKINEQYELFCENKFRVSVPKLDVPSIQELEENIKITPLQPQPEVEGNECICLPQQCQKIMVYDEFQLILKKQIQMQTNKREKKKWM